MGSLLSVKIIGFIIRVENFFFDRAECVAYQQAHNLFDTSLKNISLKSIYEGYSISNSNDI